MRKPLLIGAAAVGGLLVIVAGALVFLVSNLDDIVKKAIETVGTEVTGTKVSVGSVKISLTEGTGTIGGLTVANPKGFNTPNAFSLGEITIAIDTGSVTKNPVVIKDIRVGAPKVTYEMAQGGSNIDALQRNVQAFTAKTGGGSGAAPAKDAPKPAADEARKLVIDKLSIVDGQVQLATPIPGVEGTAKLATIVLTGIGREKSDGASAGQVAQKVLDAILKGVTKSASAFSLDGLAKGAGDAIRGAVPSGAIPSGDGSPLKGLLGR